MSTATRKLARNAQHGFGFYIGLGRSPRRQRNSGDQDRAKRLSERTSLGQLARQRNENAGRSPFATKRQPREHRSNAVNRIRPCGELMRQDFLGQRR